ncbi:hypothetical protein [Corynebacterium lactis]|uniref:Phage protein Gp19/Gp15/Gp42 n=1 Tax=Corynebacterium lactis RW2-5 TaxID=1408189 RepID=A0A0K2H323_9CORY|nr:hypothetical protein [Corynebacterium lactis]ALA68450.1 hypothetical protein CLAC_03435 [Corynebacterium lactis RW2-5]
MAKFLTSLRAVWPDADSAEQVRLERLVDRAEALIVQRFPTTLRRVEDGSLSVTVVAGVVEDMVNRAVASQDRGGVEKLAYPEVTMEWGSGGAGSGSLLYLTTDELLALTPPEPSAAFTVYRRARPSW